MIDSLSVGPVESVAHYDRIAPHYDDQMLLHPTDVLARRAFVDLVGLHVAEGSTILDFGCGTGLDAKELAGRGYRVLAYDQSPGMVAELTQRCRDEVARGRVTTSTIDYENFLARFPWQMRPNAVISNFAVVNLIDGLGRLFDAFATLLAPPGWLIVSIVNPSHWRRLATSARTERSLSAVAPYSSYRHSIRDVVRAAGQFELIGRANAGAFVRYEQQQPVVRRWWSDSHSNQRWLRRLAWHSPAHRYLGPFVFLVFRRRA